MSADWSRGWPNQLPVDEPSQAWNFFALPSDPGDAEERKRRWLNGDAFKGLRTFARYDMAMARRKAS